MTDPRLFASYRFPLLFVADFAQFDERNANIAGILYRQLHTNLGPLYRS